LAEQAMPPCLRRTLQRLITDAERAIATSGGDEARLGIIEKGELQEGAETQLWREHGGPTGKVWCSLADKGRPGYIYVEYRAAEVLAACQAKLKEGWS
jgi:hypothetical protein